MVVMATTQRERQQTCAHCRQSSSSSSNSSSVHSHSHASTTGANAVAGHKTGVIAGHERLGGGGGGGGGSGCGGQCQARGSPSSNSGVSRQTLEMALDEQLTCLMNLCKPRISVDDISLNNSATTTTDSSGTTSKPATAAAAALLRQHDERGESAATDRLLLTPPSSSLPSHPQQRGAGDDRPKSFLRDEIDEFDRIFAALSSPASSSSLSALGQVVEISESDATSCQPGLTASVSEDDMRRLFGGKKKVKDKESSKLSTPVRNMTFASAKANDATPVTAAATADSKRCSTGTKSPEGTTRPDDDEAARPVSPVSRPWMQDDRLFEQLLDDLDNIGGVNNPSARRRRKARAIFSEWLFSPDALDLDPDNGAGSGSEQRSASSDGRHSDEAKSRRKSAHVPSSIQHRQDLFVDRRPRSCDLQSLEDDADSGYHTAENTLVANCKKSPGEYTLTREDLARRIDAFNLNSHGLLMTIDEASNTFQGFIRVHMNLIRPINMSLSARPPSIYEVLSHEAPKPEDHDSQLTSFHLPKDTTKVIHILSDTTVYEVIRCLLTKFRITDSPRKFALYEKTLNSDGKSVMRKMMDDEMPLQLCLGWTAKRLNHHKFLLQENDAGEIQWDAFSIPELERFLVVLNREEAEYVEQIKVKYNLMRVNIDRQLGISTTDKNKAR